MNDKIVTNLRVDQNDWLRLKAMAAEFNMSVNEYINWIIDLSISKAPLGYPKKHRKSFYDLLENLSKKKIKPQKFELSEDDKIIYGL